MDLDVAATARYASPALTLPKGSLNAESAMREARKFESVFIAEAVKTMFDGVAVDPLNGDSNANQSWREMLVDQYADGIEQRGGFGLAGPIAHQLLAIQEASS